MTTNQPAPAELGIPIGLISEHDLREQWDRQRGVAKYWTDLSLAEQLAWAQTSAIAADRARRAAPAEPPVFALQWSENKPPGEECRYDHCTAETPFGNFLITWKSWKPYDSPTVDETPWGESWQTFATVQLAKAACQREFDAKICQLWIEAYETSPDAARATQLQEAWGDMAPADAVAGLAQLADKLREEPGHPSPPTSPAEGAAWQAAAALRRLAAQNPMGVADPAIISAAELLERLAAELAMLRQLARPVAIPGEAYDNDMGPVTWWRFPVEEEPWVGTPGDSDWPGYHTHFTPCPLVPAPPEDCPHD